MGPCTIPDFVYHLPRYIISLRVATLFQNFRDKHLRRLCEEGQRGELLEFVDASGGFRTKPCDIEKGKQKV